MAQHFTLRDRVALQYHLDNFYRISAIELAHLIGKSRSAIYYELKHYIRSYTPKSVKFNEGVIPNKCQRLKAFPFCCNGCLNITCSHRSKEYDAYQAQRRAGELLVNCRVDTNHRHNAVKVLDKTISQLIIDGVSIRVARLSVSPCDVSESTIRRYINKGFLLAKRHHLPNSIRFKVNKEYNYSRKKIAVNLLYKRTYQDYLDYLTLNPYAKVIQLDSVIGKSNDKYALLTIFFLNSKFQLAIKYTRKHSDINALLLKLYDKALELGYQLFDVILTDNGTEFIKLPQLEKDDSNSLRFQVFFCDPYRSCQKAECERNHGFIRRFIRKGKSLNLISQDQLDHYLSHINSYPRASLHDRTPYDLFTLEYDSIIATICSIDKIELIDLKIHS